MRYELMMPYEIKMAIAERWPVILPLGVLEYHGEHMAVGMDTLVVTKIFELLEKEMPLVILPAFYYGAASYAVEPPEGKGSIHVDAATLLAPAQEIFRGLLRVGFRNINVVIHHQSENFDAGMPTDLAFKFAARQAIFAHLEKEHGEGWWGRETMANYYAEQSRGEDPFNWIKTHPLTTPESMERFPFDHAGKGETSLLMALCPEGVDLTRLSDDAWYTHSARDASAALGERGRDLILARFRAILKPESPRPKLIA
jgi:creatinine amidohydrolase/Fe(II)-dependent formamide hydrolase-like protein